MERWKETLKRSISDSSVIANELGLNAEEIERVSKTFPLRLTSRILSIIKATGGAKGPIGRQFIPTLEEFRESSDLLTDPLGEDPHSPCPNVVQRYPDRCMLYVSGACAAYCRFCTRKRRVGCRSSIDDGELEEAFRFIETNTAIRDVLVSGGDPLLLDDDRLDAILTRLRAVPHVEIIRIGSRIPFSLPERITKKLCRILRKHNPLYLNLHFNHPAELDEPARRAVGRLADAGISLGSQTVLLRGVNDNSETMRTLMHELLKVRIRPYYLFQCDLVRGTEHFRTPISTGIDIIRSLQGFTSGMAVPHFAVDTPGGVGKVPFVPNYVEGRDGKVVHLRVYDGKTVDYPDN